MNSQFKFKPDKIKYLSNFNTLDSNHKKIVEDLNKKRNEIPIKLEQINKLKEELINLDNEIIKKDNYLIIRSKITDEIDKLTSEIEEISNYDEETEYFFKTSEILFNYYDILDGQIKQEIYGDSNNNNISQNKEVIENSLVIDGFEIFSNTTNSKLDKLNAISQKKRKEKKTTRKRIKNIESLTKDNNYNIFDFINSNNKNTSDNEQNSKNNQEDTYTVTDRAALYEDYKTILEGYPAKKIYTKPCINCNIDKVLIYSEGIYACMKCGEVEHCIVESEITNYKDPMIEKPTFPYKRKNHFCEWNHFNCSLELILKGLASYYKNYIKNILII